MLKSKTKRINLIYQKNKRFIVQFNDLGRKKN